MSENNKPIAYVGVLNGEDDPVPVKIVSGSIGGGGGGGGSLDAGVAINGASMPAGGVGMLGWLSAIWKLLSDRIPTLIGGRFPVNVVEIAPLASGTNTIGKVEIVGDVTIADTESLGISSLPPLPAGTNTIGKVEVTTLPALPTGANTIGKVEVTALPALPTGANTIGKVEVTALPALPAGVNTIGKVEVTALPALPAGANTIGTARATSSSQRWRDDFNGTSLNGSEWTSVAGSGQTIAVSTSELSINAGIIANAESIITSVRTFKIPCRIFIIYRLTQRIANQEFYFEITDSSGNHKAGFLLDSTVATNLKYFALNNNLGIGSIAMVCPSSGTYGIAELEIRGTEANWSSRTVDSATSRVGVGTRNRQIPDPSLSYRFQIRARNLATAPASATTLFVDAVVVEELEELNTEISTSRPATHLGNAFGVQVLNTTVPVSGTVTASLSGSISNSSFVSVDALATTTETLIALVANGIYTGATRDTSLARNTLRVLAAADQAGTLFIDQSPDASNWHQTFSSAVSAGISLLVEQKVYLRYYRIRYINGATIQGSFRLYISVLNIGA